ncbi:MAG: heat-inducible transcription repressor HrcA [Clostridiaceae bacterium]|nr:heat-inducible transcription repressor HrcA [Clostridiaceae bacterium]
MTLEGRKKHILQAIVDDYIETAEPVASKSLLSRHPFNLSSATLRNEMSDLEQLGYLEQPHTSAGRVPSDKGYREYVDSLMRIDQLSDVQADEIRQRISTSFSELTQLLKNASSALSEQTGYVSVALTPRLRSSYLKQLKMMMIEPGKVLVVVVLSAGVVKDKLVRIPDYLTAEQLFEVSTAIEQGLCGLSLEDITLVTITSAVKDTPIPDSILNQVLFEAYTAIKQADHLELYIDGSHRLLSLPEFRDVDRAKNVFDTLSRDGMVAGYLDELSGRNGPDGTYMIRIGQEITLQGLSDCSFVTTTYNVDDKIVGNIGVIGPKRMDYSKVVSQMNFVRVLIDKHLKNDNNRMEDIG